MCGIVAAIDVTQRARLPSPSLLDAMVDRLAHRGPDGRGVWRNRYACLGHRRLAIIDTSPTGAQPRVAASGAAITFNGEIYNHRELRVRLEGLGHSFTSNTDTEVLLAAYEQWGPSCLAMLRGMFAFVVVDNDRVTIGRDGFGIKPLFYTRSHGLLLVASEIKALLLHPQVDRSPSLSSLHHQLGTGRVATTQTAFAHIHPVPPGYVISFTVGRDDWHSQRVVDVGAAVPILRCSDAEAVERIDAAMMDSVRAHLVSDVPVGAWLSGGVDSAVMVATARRQRSIATFSMGFDDPVFDERDDAAQTARRLGTDHHAGVFTGSMVDAVQRCSLFNDDLLADPSLLATERLAAHASTHSRVVLSGDGADELFAGYPLYAAALWHPTMHPMTTTTTSALMSKGLAHGPRGVGRYSMASLGQRLLEGWSRPRAQALDGFRHYLSAAQQRAWLSPELSSTSTSMSMPPPVTLQDWLRIDVEQNLVADMLVKVDRASMQHGLEVRVPYLDSVVQQAAWSLPPQQLLSRTMTGKPVLRRLAERSVGKQLAWKHKRGFSVPVSAALRGPLGEWLADELSSQLMRQSGLLQTTVIAAAVQRHRQQDSSDGFALYAVLTLCLWWRTFVTQAIRTP
jgi:asparagine synthase (glutamine-hydrolysing)